METILLYFGKIIATSGILYIYYRLFLKDKTFHHYNRFYLLSILVVSLLLPLLKVSYFTIELRNDLYVLLTKIQNSSNPNTTDYAFPYFKCIAYGFGLVSVFFIGRLLFGIVKIQQFKNRFPKEQFEGINFYQTNLTEAPFSFFRNLFWKNSIQIDSEMGKQILKHEMVHIEQKHTLDKILMEVITAVFWFNPVFYLIKKEIHLIHEYLADKKSVKNSDTKAFAQMLLASHFSGNVIPATSPFLSSNLKKRLKMLQKPKTKFSYARRIFALPLIFTVAFAYLVNAKNSEIKKDNEEIAKAVEGIKRDTVIAKAVPVPESEIQLKNSKNLDKYNQDISELSSTINKKSAELKTLKPNSEEFNKKLDEITSLSDKITDITSSDNFQNSIKAAENSWSFNFDNDNTMKIALKELQDEFNSPEFKANIAQGKDFFNTEEGKKVFREMQKKMGSKEFRMKMQKGKEFFNSDEWKKMSKEFKNINFNFIPVPPNTPLPPDVVYGFDGTDLYNKNPELFFDPEKAAKKTQLSEKEAKQMEKIAKEKSKLGEKQRELAKKQAELAAEAAKLSGEKNRIIIRTRDFNSSFPRGNGSIYFNTKDMANASLPADIKYYLNGKESSKEEFNSLKPGDIESVTVNTSKNNNQGKNEIRVTTKK